MCYTTATIPNPIMEKTNPIRWSVASIVIGYTVVCFSTPAFAATPSSQDIATALRTELILDEAVNADRVSFDVETGIVSFTGTVDNLPAKERVEKIAASVVGVRGIINRIEVEPMKRPDDELNRAIREALLDNPATEVFEVNVTSSDGRVTLSGVVESWQEKKLCGMVARWIRGVVDVHNTITLSYPESRPDSEIRNDVVARLANDVRVDDALLTVSVQNDTVHLKGIVGSLAEKQRAAMDAWVGGVEAVDERGLEISWWARDTLRRKGFYAGRPDDKIRKAIFDAFALDPRLRGNQPAVSVDNGVVTITGVVDNLTAKKAAESDVRTIIGVLRVRNLLRVVPETVPPNDVLERRVGKALRKDPYIDRYELRIEAYQGAVTLNGTVNTSFEKKRTGIVAEQVPGVLHIRNNITYAYRWRWKPDWEIREQVLDQFSWSPYIDTGNVSVSVKRGIVTLTGMVATWSEYFAAEQNAFEGGAKDVKNDLVIQYQAFGPYYGYKPFYPDKTNVELPIREHR